MVLLGSVSASKTSGTDFFTADLSPQVKGGASGEAVIKIVIRVATATAVSMTLDSTNYYAINGGTQLAADTWYYFEFPVISTDTINFKQSTGTMNVICRVHQ
jgi:hypothetical protein